MITIRKLKSLNEDTRLRKATLLVKELSRSSAIDSVYLDDLLRIIKQSEAGEDRRVVTSLPASLNRREEPARLKQNYRLLDLLGGRPLTGISSMKESLDVGQRVVCKRY